MYVYLTRKNGYVSMMWQIFDVKFLFKAVMFQVLQAYCCAYMMTIYFMELGTFRGKLTCL